MTSNASRDTAADEREVGSLHDEAVVSPAEKIRSGRIAMAVTRSNPRLLCAGNVEQREIPQPIAIKPVLKTSDDSGAHDFS